MNLPLFPELEEALETVTSPLCIYERHCGSKATLGPPIAEEGCSNRDIKCLKCGATGVQSTNTALLKQKEKR